MVKEIRVNATKIEFEDDELGATRTLKQLSDGTYATGGITPISGWVEVAAGTYALATRITVASGAASIYQKSDKLRWKQGSGYKYGYVLVVADTYLDLVPNSSYAVANAAITDMAYSHIADPLGFPDLFNWVPVLTGGATDLSNYDSAIFSIKNKMLFYEFVATTRTLSGSAGNINITLPVIKAGASAIQCSGQLTYAGGSYHNALYTINVATASLDLYKDIAATNWVANETGVTIHLQGFYII